MKDFREVIYHTDEYQMNKMKDDISNYNHHIGSVSRSRPPTNFSAIKEFRKLELSDEQISGLESFGLNFSKFHRVTVSIAHHFNPLRHD